MFLNGDFEFGTLKYRAEQTPRIQRGYEPRIEWLPTKELTPRKSLAAFALVEAIYRGKGP